MNREAKNPVSLRQSMSTLHTWAGLLPGWIVYLVFLFGTLSFFQHEITSWMVPEMRSGQMTEAALQRAGIVLEERGKGAADWSVSLPGSRGGEPIILSWTPPEGSDAEEGEVYLDPTNGEELPPRMTRGGNFFYKFHYNLYYIPYWVARYLILIASFSMLTAIISGVITHKKIFADFFMLRFGKGQRSWLDAHNITSVLALPFHLMITYTGILILFAMAMPWGIYSLYENEDAFFEEAYPSVEAGEPSGVAAPVASLPTLIAQASTASSGMPTYLSITHPGHSNAVVSAYRGSERLGDFPPSVSLSGVDGKIIGEPAKDPGPAQATDKVMVQLHAGWFAGYGLRWLYFLAGVSGTVMIASGLVLWTVKRRAKLPDPDRPHFGFRLVERLNIGFIAGTSAGVAAYFLANRLLPLGIENRTEWEINSLFIIWGAVFVWTLARPARNGWVEALSVGALLYALVPLVNAVTTPRGLFPSIAAGDWRFITFDCMMLLMAACLGLAAWKLATRKAPAPRRQKPSRANVEATA